MLSTRALLAPQIEGQDTVTGRPPNPCPSDGSATSHPACPGQVKLSQPAHLFGVPWTDTPGLQLQGVRSRRRPTLIWVARATTVRPRRTCQPLVDPRTNRRLLEAPHWKTTVWVCGPDPRAILGVNREI